MKIERQAFTVAEFCEAHSLSKGTFYNLIKRGAAPATMKVGTRTLVSAEAAANWRRRMEEMVSAGFCTPA